MKVLRVLSLFDGISCGMIALKRAGIPVGRYVAYEIEPNAIKISKKNYPQIEQCGDVTKEDFTKYKDFDLLIGGSPCQDLSNYKYDRGEVKGLDGEKSSLFYYYVKALKEVKPKYFLLENVASMEKKWADVISEELGVEPIMINSALVCAAERKRLYWTNIPNIEQPEDKGIVLKDIVIPSNEVPDKYWYTKYPITVHDGDVKVKATIHLNSHKQAKEVYGLNHKCNTLLCDGNGGNLVKKIYQDNRVRKLTPLEYERLQTLPDYYTDCVADSRRYTAIGNGWTVDVIAHIFKSLFEALESDERAEIIKQPTLFDLDKEEEFMEEKQELITNENMIKWNEIDDLIGKPVFDKDNDAWRILNGYQRIKKDYFVSFTDSYDFEEVDLNRTNLYRNEELAYKK